MNFSILTIVLHRTYLTNSFPSSSRSFVNHDLLNDRSGAFPSIIRLFDGFASFRSRFRREMDARLFVGNIQRTSEMARGGTRCAASDAVEVRRLCTRVFSFPEVSCLYSLLIVQFMSKSWPFASFQCSSRCQIV